MQRSIGMIVVPLLAVVVLSGMAVLWLALPVRRGKRSRSRSSPMPVPPAPSEHTGRAAPPPVTPRPRLPGLTRTRPQPVLGPPKRTSAPRRVPTNAFSDET